MKIDEELVEKLSGYAGVIKTNKAKKYVNEKKVKIDEEESYCFNDEIFKIKAVVEGNQFYNTEIEVEDGNIETVYCECKDFERNDVIICKHILASVLEYNDYHCEADEEEELFKRGIRRNIKSDYPDFKELVKEFYNDEIEDIELDKNMRNQMLGSIKIVPKLIWDKYNSELKIEFKIGNKRMYKLKNLTEFYSNMLNNENFKYGDKLEFVHKKEMFNNESQAILEFILKYAEIISFTNSSQRSKYSYYQKLLSENAIIIGNTGLDELFDIYKNKKIEFQGDYNGKSKISFEDEEPELEFKLEENRTAKNKEYIITPNQNIYDIVVLKGKKYKYMLTDEKIYRCTNEFEQAKLKLLKIFKNNYISEIKLSEEDLAELFSTIVPKVKNGLILEDVDKEIVKKYTPEKLVVNVFLDFNENNYLIAEIKFCYGQKEFNPLDEENTIEIPRNSIEENRCLMMFAKSGFQLDKQNRRFILPDDELIYEFLMNHINIYMKKFNVLVTDNFKTNQIKQPKIGTLGIKVENDLLSIDLSKLEINVKEIQNIMEKYSLRKKYHRLKDGTFLDLEDNKDIEFLDKLITGMDINYKELEEGEVRLPVNRTLYLNQLLKGIKGTEVIKDKQYKKIVNDLNKEQLDEIDIPENFEQILRSYQKTGFKWLKTLETYKFGGILADDMGLGKTIQILSIISDYISKNEKDRKASIVVSPSSLTLNWENEAKKFAGNLKIKVIRGTLKERKELLNKINDYDMIITSYDLLKRDIEIYKEKGYTFKYIIADEAQYLKNSNTKNAKSIKLIRAETRFALTGTPIENSLAELWSIFDYIMPGYLFSYKSFKADYETPIVKNEDQYTLEKLKMLIEPFVLRRTKKEVLTELPDKTISVLNNEMGEEQRNIYLSYLSNIKEEVATHIQENGIAKSHIQILAALTRLRQICCHPGLFLKEYNQESSKLEQCIEIIEEAIESGHKILLFSGYTSMFPFIEERLQEKNIKYFKLTGATKIDQRIEMVDEFNQNSNIKVFLISLKAGGTGLNLTGADMVIHYDPWWNISAENQATDRAYRIGQKNNVQVYKLITKNSIEEKIYELQQRKAELTDNVLSTKVSFINKMSEDDIMNLFS